MSEPERITKAAIKQPEGIVWSVDPPGRHWNVMVLMEDEGVPVPIAGEQGFLTSRGRFVTRRQAEPIAFEAGQVLGGEIRGGRLTTEDLW